MRLATIWFAPTGLRIHETPIPRALPWAGMLRTVGAVEFPNPFANDPLFLEVMAEALAIQDRFSAEPIYAKTGKGYLKSVGVSEIQPDSQRVPDSSCSK